MLIGDRSLGDIVAGPGRSDGLTTPAGVPLAPSSVRPSASSSSRSSRLMRATCGPRWPTTELRRARDAGLEQPALRLGGADRPRPAHYYRVHGPTLLIEFDNTQNDANHIHSVWHDPRNDFGADLLRAHYQRGHHRGTIEA